MEKENLPPSVLSAKNAASRALFFKIFRIITSGLMIVHGTTRFLIGGIPIFGKYLSEQGFPLGVVVAGGITFFEIIGGGLMASGRFVQWIAPIFILELTMGILMVHAQHGWFVVGLSYNGVEFSIALINSMLFIWADDFSNLTPVNINQSSDVTP